MENAGEKARCVCVFVAIERGKRRNKRGGGGTADGSRGRERFHISTRIDILM